MRNYYFVGSLTIGTTLISATGCQSIQGGHDFYLISDDFQQQMSNFAHNERKRRGLQNFYQERAVRGRTSALLDFIVPSSFAAGSLAVKGTDPRYVNSYRIQGGYFVSMAIGAPYFHSWPKYLYIDGASKEIEVEKIDEFSNSTISVYSQRRNQIDPFVGRGKIPIKWVFEKSGRLPIDQVLMREDLYEGRKYVGSLGAILSK